MGEDMFFRGVRYFASAAVRGQLEAEIRAQFLAFARTGLPLDHVNAHKHFHLHPTILGMLIRVAREFGARAMRVPDEPFWFAARAKRWQAAAGGTLARALAHAHEASAARRRHIPQRLRVWNRQERFDG